MLLGTRVADFLHLPRRQGERHGSQIIAHPLLLPTRRDGYDSLVDHPPQRDLALAHIVLFRQLPHYVVDGPGFGFRDRSQRPVSGSGDGLRCLVLE